MEKCYFECCQPEKSWSEKKEKRREKKENKRRVKKTKNAKKERNIEWKKQK